MVFQFKIKIEGLSKPPVWRKVEVPASFTFLQFHNVIQTIFGWENAHLWNFEPRRKTHCRFPAFRIEEPYEERDNWDFTESMVASMTTLDKIFLTLKELVYTYDYGDDWKHSITLEGIVNDNCPCAVCTSGKGTTPPEDCGGIWGYTDLKTAFLEHDDERLESYREWLGLDKDEVWDPYSFSSKELEDINTELKHIKVPVENRRLSAKTQPFNSQHTDHPDYFTIQEVLMRKPVTELRSLAITLGFSFKSGVTKDSMLDIIANRMINEPENLIKGAFYYELKAFLDIIKGNMSLEYAEESGMLHEFNRFGLIYALDYRDGGKSVLHFQMDIADILEPLIPTELERRERDGSLLFEKLALGCANIYGYTEMYYLQDYFQMVGKRVGRDLDDTALTEAFYPILVKMETGKKTERGVFPTPFSKFVNFYPDKEHIRFEIPPKAFDFDTILKYGEMPYPQFPGRESDALRETIRKYGKRGSSADEILRKIWLNHQNSDSSPLPDLDFFNVPDMTVSQSCLNSIIEFQNNVPCWKLCGNSSQEIARIEMASINGRRPRISIGHNMRAMGIDSFEQMMDMAQNGEDLPSQPFHSSVKVGRNDPCPCGSGKKYKHCCGRTR